MLFRASGCGHVMHEAFRANSKGHTLGACARVIISVCVCVYLSVPTLVNGFKDTYRISIGF